MRIVTLNVNGIRSAQRKGLSRWLARAEPWDVVCLQDLKAGPDDVPRAMRAPRKSHGFFLHATRKGYAGVALYAKLMPKVTRGFGFTESDGEGRYLIHPYMLYRKQQDLNRIHACATAAVRRLATYHRCFVIEADEVVDARDQRPRRPKKR